MGSKELTRGAGVLLAITSLPSSYGIGTLGEAAFQFVDLLVDLKQRYWQVLPIGPTSFGNSPYQSYSAFAGNPYLIDLDDLVKDGLLQETGERMMQILIMQPSMRTVTRFCEWLFRDFLRRVKTSLLLQKKATDGCLIILFIPH